jgi:hypothetical protein
VKLKPGVEEQYKSYVETNSKDPYSHEVVLYAERWAELMEEALKNSETLPSMWKYLSHRADTDGVTGFMYGCAVEALARYWIHGDELRQLHNREYGVSEEKAQGGTVNPAILKMNK